MSDGREDAESWYSSSEDEFFDPEEEMRSEPPSPSWLTRTMSAGSSGPSDASGSAGGGEGGGGLAEGRGTPFKGTPTTTPEQGQISHQASLDVSVLAATMPSVTGVDGPSPGEDPAAAAADASTAAKAAAAAAAAAAAVVSQKRLTVDDAADAADAASSSEQTTPPAATAGSDLARRTTSSGTREFAMEKVFRIKDLDTGQEFLVDEAAADSMMMGGGGGGAGGGVGDGTAKVKDLQTGRELSVKEFEDSLGLSPLMREVSLRERSMEQSREGEPQEPIGTTSSVGTAVASAVDKISKSKKTATVSESESAAAKKHVDDDDDDDGGGGGGRKNKKKPFGRNPGRWFTKRFGEAKAYLVSGGDGESPTSMKKKSVDGPGYSIDQDDPAMRAIRAAAAAAGQSDPPDFNTNNRKVNGGGGGGGDQHGGGGTSTAGREGVGSTVKVHVNRKVYKEYTEMRLIQVLHAHEDAVWTMKFSHNGEYLATAGQDRVVRVWALDREEASGTEEGTGDGGAAQSVGGKGGNAAGAAAAGGGGLSRKPGSLRLRGELLFREKPHREYAGHKADILDLCWSHTDWLLSSSMDKTVRLWYMTMDECLRIFSHQDFVTAIDFNPVNDKYFLSGSLDGKLRFWNIPDHRVADWVDIGEMVTAACFTSDGACAVAGSYKGKCHFYSMDGVRFDYLTQLEVRNSRSNKLSGKKITGLSFMPGDDRKLLVTSNDSRIRVYDGYTLACKYKGHKNNNSQIRASFSPGAEFIVCGSEDEHVYVWSTINSFVPSINPIYTGYRRDKHSSYEQFAAQHDIATVALFAPEEVRNARTGEAAAAVAAARAAAKDDLQPTRAAAALFKGGGYQSPGGSGTLTPRSAASGGGGGQQQHHHSRTNSSTPPSKTLGGGGGGVVVEDGSVKEGVGSGGANAGSDVGSGGGKETIVTAAATTTTTTSSFPGGGAAGGGRAGGDHGGVDRREGGGATTTTTTTDDDDMDPRAEARAEGERAFAAGMAIGQIIVTAGYSGEIRIFENVGSPCWL